jgi:hypothetical protein
MEITFEPKQKYVFVKAKGEIDLQISKELFVRLLGICAEQKLFKVIVDYREIVGYISIMDRLVYLEGIDALHKAYLNLNMPKLRIAYVAPSNLIITEPAVLDQREALTFDNMATHDIESAEEWVMK